ncbi:MAG: hypothetical protein GF418_06620 [Chitinivibrionales bacterium]|nr:hypothetical protein [Chitinivibrionales bacterium]MBD3395284.1 hypothetical protein [Chitinivibrionales bacterium]
MRTAMKVLAAVSIMAIVAAAQGPHHGRHMMGGPGAGTGKGAAMHKGCGMMGGGMMMGFVMPRKVVPTDDGGVIVVVGNRLIKYDKNLKLKNEAEITVDWDKVKKQMEKMHENCPWYTAEDKEDE